MLPLLKAMGQDRVCVCVYVGGDTGQSPLLSVVSTSSTHCHPQPPAPPMGAPSPPQKKNPTKPTTSIRGDEVNHAKLPLGAVHHSHPCSRSLKSPKVCKSHPPPNKSPSESPPQPGALPPRYGATCRRTTPYGLATLSPHWSTELTNEKGGVCPALPPQPIARRRSSGLPGRADGQREAWPRGGSSRRKANESGGIGVGGVSVGGTPSQWGARGAWPGFQRVRRRAAEQW